MRIVETGWLGEIEQWAQATPIVSTQVEDFDKMVMATGGMGSRIEKGSALRQLCEQAQGLVKREAQAAQSGHTATQL